ncbi:hypothetical protein AWC38_SpisGene6933 [Stylophora pistillata]|uniref:Uncharacterized protein n=1 Tax=Stylophora pistillata TaxID=50429 RepID=A0A2B4SIG9_STYPI|nr:hypothetical protein AWC38_SpisGene6933 [Stylophora pistillata]
MDLGRCCAFVAFLAVLYFASVAEGKPARILIKYNKTRDIFELNRTVLDDLWELQRPIRVIAVVGDARIGKSTTLNVVIRGALGDPDGGKTIEDYTKDCIVEASFEESMNEERKAIAKHFPRNQIIVSQIPQVERDLFKDFDKLRKSDYWQEMKRVVEKLKTFPIKKTLGGSPMDGKGLVELAWYLKDTMNANSWLDFANVYVTLEKNICKRSRVKLIEPLFVLPTADEIEARIEDALRNFAMECKLQTEISAVQKDLQHFESEKRKAEELELKAKEAESQRRAAEKKNEELKQKFQHQMSEKNIEIERVKREKEEAELNEKNFKQLHQEQMKTIALLQEELRKKSDGLFDFIGRIIHRVIRRVKRTIFNEL